MSQPPKRPQTWLQRLWRELLEPIVFAVVITQFVATLVGVDGVSMMPNLRHHERVLVPKWEPWLHKIGIGDFQRGDILIFKPPSAAQDERRSFLNLWQYRPFLIKRLIGLPGDKISISGGVVTVNGTVLDGSFTSTYWQQQGCWDTQSTIANTVQSDERYSFMSAAKTFTVPPKSYFLMGDNRTQQGSLDSRLFGPVAQRDIAGRAVAVVWPIMRQVNAKYDCNTSGDPDTAVSFSGNSVLNLRGLPRPPAFDALNK